MKATCDKRVLVERLLLVVSRPNLQTVAAYRKPNGPTGPVPGKARGSRTTKLFFKR